MSYLRHSLLVGGLAVIAASIAHVGEATAQVCDPTTLLCSMGGLKPRVEGNDRLQTSIDSGWVPECPGTAAHCSDHKFQVRAQIAFDPIGGGEGATPVYVVDMPKDAVIQAVWPTTDAFELNLRPATQPSATFRVTHSLTPEFGIFLNLSELIGFGGQTEINIDANDLINLLPGAQFNYMATKSTNFAPWAFEPVSMNLVGNDLGNSRLFAVTFEQLGELVGTGSFNDYIEGSFSFNARTDTNFTYRTTGVQIIGSAGPITSADGTTLLPMSDGNYLEFAVVPTGELTYDGVLEMLPVINITSIAGFGITLNFPISVGLDFPFSSDPITLTFPTQMVHIPLPNVFVPSSFVDFGQVETGNKSDKKVTIDNTGEMGATLTFSSSDPQFSTLGITSTQVGPEQVYDLTVSFRPTRAGSQRAVITVTSNDPDSPVQEFEVLGYGTGEDLPDDQQPGGGAGGGAGSGGFNPSGGQVTEDSGCGCSVPASSTGGSSLALLGAAGLLLLRRRRHARG